ncbi:type II toxin-antitoxin system VapC family toxin [Xenorhabdus ishibashii]|uniref:Twitching motility protein PilT n=1 Tax=Xenorhabdus ishibashii TaxID=1034471 RepID=A0A2D0K8F9_9GAMM|nr:type II toxin-antitoxin system VapC family toxin [Xenorhabdus ishibashii]PHM59497.1 twitching motility protein PilT [Xenorhabdus ishibashii]
MNKIIMLDTNICSFIMREQPEFLLEKLQESVMKHHSIVISAITYAELHFGAVGKKVSTKHVDLLNAFCERLDAVLSWDKAAVEETMMVKKCLSDAGTPIGNNDSAIAGHAIAVNAILMTNNIHEFSRIERLKISDWIID